MVDRLGSVQALVEGNTFVKLIDGKGKPYLVKMDPTCHSFVAGDTKQIDVSCIKAVRSGFVTQEFMTHGEAKKIPEERALSIVYVDGAGDQQQSKVLNLVAENQELREWWEAALKLLVGKVRERPAQQRCTAVCEGSRCWQVNDATGEAYSVMGPWLSHLREGKDTISWKTALELLESLNMRVSAKEVKQIIADFDVDGDSRLNFAEFITAIRRLRSHSVVSQLFATYANKATKTMDAAQLVAFAAKEQLQAITAAEAALLIAKYSFGKNVFDEVAFQFYMISEDNSAWRPDKEARHHDMSKPLNMYYIDRYAGERRASHVV